MSKAFQQKEARPTGSPHAKKNEIRAMAEGVGDLQLSAAGPALGCAALRGMGVPIG